MPSFAAAPPLKSPPRRPQQGQDPLFQALIATAVDGIVVIDENGVVQIYNQACERLFQYSPDEVIGRNVRMLMPAPYRAEHDDYLSQFKESGERRVIGIGREVVGQRKDGSQFPMYLSVGEGSASGRPIFVGIIHDISALRRMENARDYLASIVESSGDAIIAMTLDGTVTAWNEAAEKTFGYTAAEMVGQPISQLLPRDLISEEDATVARVKEGERVRGLETRRLRKDGREIQVSLTASPIRNAAAEIIGASKIARDISEQKAAEARFSALQSELIHLSRWNTMGMMASSIAHELNQPLAAMTNYLGALKRVANAKPRNEKLLNELVEKAAQQGQRAATIIQHVRDLVAKGKSEKRTENLAGVVREALQIASVATRQSGIDLHFEAEPALPPIQMDRIQIQQVIINLARNAAEAMGGLPVRQLRVSVRRDEEWARVDVADTGPGLPQIVAEHLFEAFVTTKSSGMGLGLSICEQIVTGHGGRLWASANDPSGTVFSFTLPLRV